MSRSDAAPDEDFFRALERRRTRALVERDMPVLDDLHALDYELITPAGKVFTRQAYLDAIASESFYAAWDAGEMAVRCGLEMAVLRYPVTLRFPSGREIRCWHLDIYEKRAAGWQAVWSQATELRQPPPAANPDE